MLRLLKLLTAATALAWAPLTQAVSFDYSNLPNTTIRFHGNGTFDFTPGDNFHVTSGSLSGLSGAISGLFTIGAGVETASVSGLGTFSLHDGTGESLTADLVWSEIFRKGAIGGVNFNAWVNLTNLNYTGTNASLLEFVSDGSAMNTLTFQFSRTGDLDTLRTRTLSTSFSGTVSSVAAPVPDGGTTAALLGGALIGFAALTRSRWGRS